MTALHKMLAEMTGDKVNWAAYDSEGRATVFRAPDWWPKAEAMKLAELLYPGEGFVTVAQL